MCVFKKTIRLLNEVHQKCVYLCLYTYIFLIWYLTRPYTSQIIMPDVKGAQEPTRHSRCREFRSVASWPLSDGEMSRAFRSAWLDYFKLESSASATGVLKRKKTNTLRYLPDGWSESVCPDVFLLNEKIDGGAGIFFPPPLLFNLVSGREREEAACFLSFFFSLCRTSRWHLCRLAAAFCSRFFSACRCVWADSCMCVWVKGACVGEAVGGGREGGMGWERRCFTERWMGWIEGAAGVDWQAGWCGPGSAAAAAASAAAEM